MGLLDRLLKPKPRGYTIEVQSLEFERCTEWVAVVGEASYQQALRQLCGSQRWERVRFECRATLMPEPDNPFDPNAVRIHAGADGAYLHVGYLSRGDALDYKAVVQGTTQLGYAIACDAHIAGREAGSETHNLGIFLELPTPEECLKQLAESMGDPAETAPEPAARHLPEATMDWSRFDNHRRVQVVGAQYHQPALLTASKGLITRDTDRCEREATLLREPDNEHDPKAVQVMVDGQRVGYLKSGTAKRLNKRVKTLEDEGKQPTYPLLIRLQGPGMFQAHLQIPYESELLAGYKNPKKQ